MGEIVADNLGCRIIDSGIISGEEFVGDVGGDREHTEHELDKRGHIGIRIGIGFQIQLFAGCQHFDDRVFDIENFFTIFSAFVGGVVADIVVLFG